MIHSWFLSKLFRQIEFNTTFTHLVYLVHIWNMKVFHCSFKTFPRTPNQSRMHAMNIFCDMEPRLVEGWTWKFKSSKIWKIYSLLLFLPWLIILLNVSGATDQEVGLDFTEQPEDAVALKGSPFLLNCSASTDTGQRQVNITWLKDGQPINDAKHYHVLRNDSLFFKRVVHKPQRSRSDEGIYQCKAQDSYGTIVSRRAHLQVASKYTIFLSRL